MVVWVAFGAWFGRFAPVDRRDAYPTLGASRLWTGGTPILLWALRARGQAGCLSYWRLAGRCLSLFGVGVEGFSDAGGGVVLSELVGFVEVGLGEGDGDGDGGDRLASRFCAGWREVVGDVHEDGGGFFAALFFADGAACFVDEVAAFFGGVFGVPVGDGFGSDSAHGVGPFWDWVGQDLQD